MSSAPEFTRNVQLRIREKDAGQSLVSLLAGRFSYRAREEWMQEIAAGHLLLNGFSCKPETILVKDDLLTYLFPSREEPPVDFRYTVLAENDHFLVVDKSGNLPCHPAGRYFSHTLWAALRERGIAKPEFVNRLDRETSGIVLIAKSAPVAKVLRTQFQKQQVEKNYTVLVEGLFPDTLQANGWLIRDSDSPIRKKRRFVWGDLNRPPDSSAAEWAETSFRFVSCRDNISRVSAALHTGRTHQIRATLASLGFPIVGDKIYGVDDTLFLRFCEGRLSGEDRSRLRIPRQALHASRLVFSEPTTGERRAYTAPLPPELCALL